ncbi:Uncharacterized protein TPAR_07792 [Tolypocladium paradoxum]|uniref:Uncharacterized protein n=1 Tax=Tolypocladium paradoxum TaxID=94208 RepID=A0A2S4KP88_9HYPO|nr:Uncharacterized protein TPAR_07792 [Tolypocladium paradoxum]
MATQLPSTPSEWRQSVAALGSDVDPLAITLSDFAQHQLGSASKMDHQHWLFLRIICTKAKAHPTPEDLFGSDSSALMQETTRRLHNQAWWRVLQEQGPEPLDWGYMALWKQSTNEIQGRVETLRTMKSEDKPVYSDSDPFKIIVEPRMPGSRPHRSARDRATTKVEDQRRQDELIKAALPKERSSSTESAGKNSASGSAADSGTGALIAQNRPDEALINMSLVLFLQGLLLSLKSEREKCRAYNWTIMHKMFTVTQPGLEGRVPLLTAKTDGCLQVRSKRELAEHCDTLAILEVKPYRRYYNPSLARSVLMQEGAEMAAWISTECSHGLLPSRGDNKHRRVLISQGFDEVFITVAEFDDSYIGYITGKGTQWPQIEQLTPSRAPRSEAVNDSGDESSPDERAARTRDTGRDRRERGRDDADRHERGREAGKLSSAFKGLQLGKESKAKPAAAVSSATRSQSAQKRTTPSPPSSTTPPGAPTRPVRATEPLLLDGKNGFLVMRQYTGFKLAEPQDVQRLATLLMSLTQQLCEKDALGRFRG